MGSGLLHCAISPDQGGQKVVGDHVVGDDEERKDSAILKMGGGGGPTQTANHFESMSF